MGDIYNELIPAAEATQIARLMVADEDLVKNQFLLSRWFPPVAVEDIEFRWTTGTTRAYTPAAPFRNFDVPAHIGTRPGRSRKHGQMPPLSMEYLLTELDQLRIQQLRGTAGGREVVEGDVFDDIARGIKAIENRFELVRSDALISGASTLAEKGISLTANWGRAAGRASTVGVLWSVPASAVPMNNEEAVLDVMADEEGLAPADIVAVMNRFTWRLYKNTTQVKSAFPSFRVLDTISVAAANQVRQDNDFPEVIVYDAQTQDYSGTLRKVIPNGKVLYLPKGQSVGQTQYGIPVVASDPEIGLERNDRPGPVAYMSRVTNPYRLSTVVDALGFPVFMDTNATYCLTVA
jgi:hypothetical protein